MKESEDKREGIMGIETILLTLVAWMFILFEFGWPIPSDYLGKIFTIALSFILIMIPCFFLVFGINHLVRKWKSQTL